MILGESMCKERGVLTFHLSHQELSLLRKFSKDVKGQKILISCHISGSSLSFDSILSPILLSMGQGGPVPDPLSLVSSSGRSAENCKIPV